MANNYIQISVDGSKKHAVRDVRVEKCPDDSATATGYVSGKPVSVNYTGTVASEFGTTEGKPWLRRVREDLVRKYISIYGDVVQGETKEIIPSNKYSILVDDKFISRLTKLGYNIENYRVMFSNGRFVYIRGKSQVEVLRHIKFEKDLALQAEKELINILFKEIA